MCQAASLAQVHFFSLAVAVPSACLLNDRDRLEGFSKVGENMTDTEGRDVEPEASTSTSSATAGATPAAAAAAMDVVVTETGSSEAAAALDQQEGTASTISTTTAAPSSKAPAKKKGGQEVDPRRSHIQLDHYVMFQLPSKNIKLLRLTPDMQVINLGKCGSFPAPELIGKPYGVTFEVVPPVLKDEDGNVMEVDAVDNDDGGRKRKSQQQQQQTSKEHRKKQKGKASAAAAGSKVPPPLTDPAGYGEDWSTATSEQQTPLSTLKQLQGLALEAIEDPGSTNENILATGAKTLSHEEIDEMKKRGMSGRVSRTDGVGYLSASSSTVGEEGRIVVRCASEISFPTVAYSLSCCPHRTSSSGK